MNRGNFCETIFKIMHLYSFVILWNCLQDDPDSEDEDKYADRADMPGQKFDTKRWIFTGLVHELNKHDTALILQLLNDEHMKLKPFWRTLNFVTQFL